jgi:cytochrome c553
MLASLVVAAAVSFVVLAPRAEAADAEAGRKKVERCGPCHGPAGNSTLPTVPSLAGQPPTYTYYQLILFRDERRRDPQMTPFAAGLSDADMQDIAAYYAAQAAAAPKGAPDAATIAAGERLTAAHFCTSCHTPNLMGQKHIPRLAGQPYEYLLKQLRGFKTQTASDLDGSMTTSAQPLTDQDIEVLARYLAHLPPPAR